ncbi:phage regulatory protein/antirepressor Ant [Nostoc sp. UIC 10630]|uniref:phage antirepressor KilAC domain-containing protein n=1 Tax=Nostoc sp. UIC 10630 TaxID=2100146 RepID=UPI0013D17036|nr:phage regulatory protein/antirepressor Ant [Nostoc sp. UIC 10630]NEU82233.1 hypothetical protein [Nostoc sp. UIC 10630]
MTNITIQTINSTLVIDSRLIAAELGIQHKNLKELIKTYQADFEEFGQVAFETQAGDIRYAETFYYLNEDQSYLALTFVKNTTEARQAKINLVKAFRSARESLAPKPNTDILYLLEQSAAAIREARLQASIAEEKVAELKPKSDAYDVVLESGKLLSFSEVAKIINSPGLGRNNLMSLLRDKGILQFTNLPYQQYITPKYFEVILVDTSAGLKPTCKVTGKGLSFLIRLLKDNGYTVPSKSLAA